MYATFNMGIGFCIVVGKAEQQAALDALKAAGEDAIRIGTVTARAGPHGHDPRRRPQGQGRHLRAGTVGEACTLGLMDVRDYIAANAAEFSQALRDWLSHPLGLGRSGPPRRRAAIGAVAGWLPRGRPGFPVAEVWETDGLPAVYAHWPAADPGAPRVLVYGHHDVQPAALDDGWDYEPFAPQEKDGRIFGRGASDDKGQVLFHALGVARPCCAAPAARTRRRSRSRC